MTGADFGAQDRPFISPKLYRDLFKPFHKRVNDWIHDNTSWKSFMHSDGAMWKLLPDVVEAGFDILNPVQTSAADMEPVRLKETYGDRLTFWGAGDRDADDAPVRHAGRGPGRGEGTHADLRPWAAATSSTRSTTCRRASRSRTSSPSTRP